MANSQTPIDPNKLVFVDHPDDPAPPIMVVMPDGSMLRWDELPKYPPPGQSPEELELQYENEEDERLFGEHS